MYVFIFFQAEDGIRDGPVTGVQTCALPILKNDDTAIKKFEAKIKNESAAVMWHYMISSSVLGQFLAVLTFLMLNGQALITSIKKLSYPAWVNTFSSITAVTTLIAAFTPAVNADEFTENFQEVLEAQATKEI